MSLFPQSRRLEKSESVVVTHLQLYGEPRTEQVENLKSTIEDYFLKITGGSEIHNRSLWLKHYCEDICAIDKEKNNSNKNVSA